MTGRVFLCGLEREVALQTLISDFWPADCGTTSCEAAHSVLQKPYDMKAISITEISVLLRDKQPQQLTYHSTAAQLVVHTFNSRQRRQITVRQGFSV